MDFLGIIRYIFSSQAKNGSDKMQPMMIDDEGADTRPNNATPRMQSARPDEIAPENDIENNQDIQEVTTYQARRARIPRVVPVDDQTALRNTELAQINNEYVQNMLAVLKQKEQNKLPAQAKKNAAFWVFGQGIGSVGVGLGASHTVHPLCVFSGDGLHALLSPETKRKARKRGRRAGDNDEESGSDSDGRRVRARGESEEQIGRGENGQMHDVRILSLFLPKIFRDLTQYRTSKSAVTPHLHSAMTSPPKCPGTSQPPSKAPVTAPQPQTFLLVACLTQQACSWQDLADLEADSRVRVRLLDEGSLLILMR